MQIVPEVRKRAGFQNGKIVDVYRVAVVPSEEDGVFIIDDPTGKARHAAVGKITLLDVPLEDVAIMHAMGEFDLDQHVATDEKGNSTVTRAEATVPIQGSNNSVSTYLSEFVEFGFNPLAEV